jgi:hypothetical protein
MTFGELARSLPNGVHDAEICRIAIDYCARTVVLEVNFWVGDLDALEESRREERRRGIVTADGLVFCAIDAPDPGIPTAGGGPLTVSGDVLRPGTFPAHGRIPSRTPPGTSRYRLFVSEWNAFIYIAAKSVTVAWQDG